MLVSNLVCVCKIYNLFKDDFFYIQQSYVPCEYKNVLHVKFVHLPVPNLHFVDTFNPANCSKSKIVINDIFYCFSEYLQNKGVDCFYDNIKLILTSHVVYMCVLPSQIPSIAEELKHNIPPTVILYSLVSTYTTKKLKQILLTTNIIHPEFNWTEESHTNHWDCTLNVNAALENRETVEKTCPIGFKKSGKFLMINIE